MVRRRCRSGEGKEGNAPQGRASREPLLLRDRGGKEKTGEEKKKKKKERLVGGAKKKKKKVDLGGFGFWGGGSFSKVPHQWLIELPLVIRVCALRVG